jgi:hypothetical protein
MRMLIPPLSWLTSNEGLPLNFGVESMALIASDVDA